MQDRIKGSALLTALFIMTLIVIVTMGITVRVSQKLSLMQSKQRYHDAERIEDFFLFWAMDKLNRPKIPDFEKPLQPNSSLMQGICQPFQCKVVLRDAQASFNVNSIVKAESLLQFRRFLARPPINLPATEQSLLLQALYYWLSPFQIFRGQDAANALYMKENPPYQAAHQSLSSITELKLIHSIPIDLYNKMLPYIVALPEPTPINIFSAPKIWLKTLSPRIADSDIEEIYATRGVENRAKIPALFERLKKANVSKDLYTTESTYFILETTLHYQDTVYRKYAILRRVKRNSRMLYQVSLIFMQRSGL